MQQKQYENEQYDRGFSPIIRAFVAIFNFLSCVIFSLVIRAFVAILNLLSFVAFPP